MMWTLVTAVITMLTAIALGITMLTDHWEKLTYSFQKVQSGLTGGQTIRDYFSDGRAYVITSQDNTANPLLLLQLYGGLWHVCYDLTGND